MIDYLSLGSESRFVGSAPNVFSDAVYFVKLSLRIFQKSLVALFVELSVAGSVFVFEAGLIVAEY